MTQDQLCISVYKRAFYHAYNNYLLNDSKTTTVVAVKYNRVFFYDSITPKFFFRDGPGAYYTSIIIHKDKVPTISQMGKEMMTRIHDDDDKRLITEFITDFNERDMFVDHDLYEELFYHIKHRLTRVYEDYIQHLINLAWFNHSQLDSFEHELNCMKLAFKTNEIKRFYPEHFEELLGLILDNYNVPYCLDKSFIESRSEVIHVVSDSGVLEIADE